MRYSQIMDLKRTAGLLLLAFCLAGAGCAPAMKANIDETSSGLLVWPAPPERPRIEYLWSLYSFVPEGEKLEDYLQDAAAGFSDPSSIPYMYRPNATAVDSAGRLFIVDQGIPRVTAVDLKTRGVKHFGFDGPGQLLMPIGIALDASDRVYVTDSEAGRVNRYTRDGDFDGTLGGADFFKRPTGIVFERLSGRIFVLDTGAHKVHAFDNAGRHLFSFGGRGSGDGEFNFPTHMAAGFDGKIYITDALNFRIQYFGSDGQFLAKFGRHGDTYSDLETPKGVAADTEGNIYVVDAAQDMIKIFDSRGRLLLFFGENGRGIGKFVLPLGISIDSHNRIYVADTYNMRIQVFRLLDGKVDKT